MSSRLGQFWENTKRITKLAKRPDRSEIWLQFKISMLGLFAIGAVGFMIRLIMIVVSSFFISSAAS
jgi:protein translocase SEC61 complex gamma subunit